jgi:hypothetical protein
MEGYPHAFNPLEYPLRAQFRRRRLAVTDNREGALRAQRPGFVVCRQPGQRRAREARPVRQRDEPGTRERRRGPAAHYDCSRRPDDLGNDYRGHFPSGPLSHFSVARLGRRGRYRSIRLSRRSDRDARPDELGEDGLSCGREYRLRQRTHSQPDSIPDFPGVDPGRRRIRPLHGPPWQTDHPSGSTAWGDLQRMRPSSARVHVGPPAQPARRLLLSSLRKHLDPRRQRQRCVGPLRRDRRG